MTSSCVWPSPNSPTARACAISRSACARPDKLYHLGLRGRVARTTLAHANPTRDGRLYADFAHALIRIARPLYAEDDLGLDLDYTVYALDSSTIDLCLTVFP